MEIVKIYDEHLIIFIATLSFTVVIATLNFDSMCLGESGRPGRLCVSYPRFDDSGPRVQNALHLPQRRDDKKITGDNSGHRIS